MRANERADCELHEKKTFSQKDVGYILIQKKEKSHAVFYEK
jgi:hypothetical protein